MARRATRPADKPAARAVPPSVRGTSSKTGPGQPGLSKSVIGKPVLDKPVLTKSAVTKSVLGKAGKPTTKASRSVANFSTALDLDGLTADQQMTAMLRDREKLVARLQAAEARIAAMEAREEQLTDRISWALDTLNDVLRSPDVS